MMEQLGMTFREVRCGEDGEQVRHAGTPDGFSVAGMPRTEASDSSYVIYGERREQPSLPLSQLTGPI
jgi:hypothetical protein